jgi:hypothetical protein
MFQPARYVMCRPFCGQISPRHCQQRSDLCDLRVSKQTQCRGIERNYYFGFSGGRSLTYAAKYMVNGNSIIGVNLTMSWEVAEPIRSRGHNRDICRGST